MDNIVDINIPVYDLVQNQPELLDLLVEQGFKPLKNPLMLKTLGKSTTLKQGAKLIRIDLDQLVQVLEWNGYEVKGVTEDVGRES